MLNILKSYNEGRLVKTSTGELFIPVRLYYRIHNKALLVKAINKLKCAEFAEWDKNYFIISYYKEAKKLDLDVFYQEVPPELYPVRLADCYIKNSFTLYIDLKSFQRAIEMINFLSKHIRPSNIIEITGFAHGNNVTVCKNEEELQAQFDLDYGVLFDHLMDGTEEKLTKYLDNTKQKRLLDTDGTRGSEAHAMDNILSDLYGQEKYNYPTAEKINIRYQRSEHQDLLNMLIFRSGIKQKVAVKRYEGYKNYTSFDAINDFLEFASKLET